MNLDSAKEQAQDLYGTHKLDHCLAGYEQWEALQVLTELGLWDVPLRDGHSEPHQRYSRYELEFIANYGFIANSMKRKGERSTDQECKLLRHYFEVPKPRWPELKSLISGDPC